MQTEKPIRLSAHAAAQAATRGAPPEEVVDAVRGGDWTFGRCGRYECSRNLPGRGRWQGVTCALRRVQPSFTVQATHIVVVSVFVTHEPWR